MGASILNIPALGAPLLGSAWAKGSGSACGWVGAARVTADSTHFCQASILAVWLGCMKNFVAARTVNVGELRLSGLVFGCIVL
jgi:hypothetical protein